MRTTAPALIAAAAMLAAACGGSGGGTAAAPSVERGRSLFATSCAQCHGDALQGTQQGPPLIHEYYVPSHHSDDAFRLAARRGVQQHHWEFGAMPPVQALNADEIEHIIAFVRDAQRQAGLID